MDNTAPCSTFSTRSNARRAAEKMDHSRHRAGGRLRHQAARRWAVRDRLEDRERDPGHGEIQTEITTATAAEPSAATSEPALPAAPAATEAAEAAAAPEQPAAEAEAAPEPTPAAAAPIGAESEPAPQGDQDPEVAAFETPRLIAELERRGYRTTQARQRRTQRPPAEQGGGARRGRSARRHANQAGRRLARQPSLPEALRQAGRTGRGHRLGRSGRLRAQRHH
jgi:hypothetical protein